MGRMSMECRQRVVTLWKSGVDLSVIQQHFKGGKDESIYTSYCLVKKFSSTGQIRVVKRKSRLTCICLTKQFTAQEANMAGFQQPSSIAN